MNRVEIAEVCATVWTSLGINWVAVHGLEGYPDTLGRDIDILVADHDRKALEHSTVDLFRRSGLAVARPPDIWGTRVLGFGEGQALEIHAVSKIAWREMVLAETPNAIESFGPFPVDPWASLVKQVVLPAFAGEGSKAASALPEHDLAAIREQVDNDRIAELILDTLGEASDARQAVAALTGRRSTLARLKRKEHPVVSAVQIGAALVSKFRPLISPSGVIVTVDGTDRRRVGDVLDALDSGRRSVFTGVRVRHCRDDETGRRSGWLNTLRSEWSDRRFIGHQTVVFRRWYPPRTGASLLARSPHSDGPQIYLDFENGGGHQGGRRVLPAADQSLESLIGVIWREVEMLFAETFPP